MKKFVAILSLACITGCSFLMPKHQNVMIRPSNPMAKIRVDGMPAGIGPISIPMKRDQAHFICAEFEGREGYANIGTRLSITGVLDLIGGVFYGIPFLGLLSSGSHSLDRTEVDVYIQPAKTEVGGQ